MIGESAELVGNKCTSNLVCQWDRDGFVLIGLVWNTSRGRRVINQVLSRIVRDRVEDLQPVLVAKPCVLAIMGD